ncbi:GNAT family N-acetyltransferase [Rhodanobacter sp. L36]|uniref:GNAT family N-acetyltransferase n=1 Tax=Rhodanobacter sp. L36 TaxID=1747221 RepID=UPI00131BAF0D|nr:GNAT family N-acetyltransferase [Rhodanobacter sp. L36]
MDGHLRPARIDDAAEIARLASELCYPAVASDMASRLSCILTMPAHRVVVFDGGDALFGWIAIEHRLTLESGERVEIVGLVVSASARQGGVGRLLVGEAERWARSLGLDTITVRSNIARDASHPFYERLGYVRRKTQHVYHKALDTTA